MCTTCTRVTARLDGDADGSSRVERMGSGRDAYLPDVALVERKAKNGSDEGRRMRTPRQRDSSATKNSAARTPRSGRRGGGL